MFRSRFEHFGGWLSFNVWRPDRPVNSEARILEGICSKVFFFRRRLLDLQTDSGRSKQTPTHPNKQLRTYSDSYRHLETDSDPKSIRKSRALSKLGASTSPRSSGTKKLSIPNWFDIVLHGLALSSIPYSPSPCRQTDSNRHLCTGFTRPCRRCLFHIARARAGKWTLTDASEEALHRLVEGVCPIFPERVQENGL